MPILIGTQIVVSVIAALATLSMSSETGSVAVLYGCLVAIVVTLLARRSVDKALNEAVQDSGHAMVVIFSGFALRYAVAILGLLTGFKVIKLLPVPMLAGFVLIIMVQVLVSFLIRPESPIKD